MLSTATLVGVGTTGGGLLTYQQMKRLRAAGELPSQQDPAPDREERDGKDGEPRSSNDE